MEEIRRRKGKVNWGKSEGEMKHERLWTLRNKLTVFEGRFGGGMCEPGDGYERGHILHGAQDMVRKQ